MKPQKDRLWYRESAKDWNEALPIGNGRMGAMIFGGAADEKILLNEDTLWSGMPGRFSSSDAVENFRRARDLTMEGDYEQAQKVIEEDFLKDTRWSQIYLPLGEINVHMRHGEVSRYSRSLNLCTALHNVIYMADNVLYEREMFMSHPHQCLILAMRCNKKGAMNCTVSLKGALESTLLSDKDDIVLTGHCPQAVFEQNCSSDQYTYVYGKSPADQGIGYAARLRVKTDGELSVKNNEITVKNAGWAIAYFTCRTSFNGYDKHPVLEGKEYLARCLKELDEASDLNYLPLKNAHLEDYTPLYSQMELDLGGGDAGLLPTNERLLRHEQGLEDNALYALLFNYGRYLTIAASREGTQAMNLQGIWNSQMTPPWHSNYTLNINTEMNYWPTMRMGLSSCMKPFLSLMDELTESGKWTAKEYYGASGAAAHHNTDLWRMSAPVGAGRNFTAEFGFWPMSLGWLTRGVWEYYLYTDDEEYLRQRGYPVMREAAEFMMDMLITNDEGELVFAPATSPENLYYSKDKKSLLSIGKDSAMNQSIIRDLFERCIAAEKVLKKVDDPLEKRLLFILPKLSKIRTDDEGRIMEWSESVEEKERLHRHMSPLYGLYPACEFNENTPRLLEACRKTMKSRGDVGTGWSLGWKINLWARLHEGEKALQILDLQLMPVYPDGKHQGGGTFFNMFDAHPPFQIDGNFGAAAGIMEMLCQADEEGKITLLPALPERWKSGSLRGLRLPHGKTLDMEWADGKVTNSVIR